MKEQKEEKREIKPDFETAKSYSVPLICKVEVS